MVVHSRQAQFTCRPLGSSVPRARRGSVINRRGSTMMKKVSAKTALIQLTSQASSVVNDFSSEMSDLSTQQAQFQQEIQDTMASLQKLIDNMVA